ncbi:sugar-transfer associated ATP-grasp domain-containing protein, partial [Brevibacillus sp. SIMBA_076]|uniref:sugar-transfer associated ATP-grasp domain-containing protein n=1 Tax=Brevibacillus sp. SIMBA_076 TaxID=3085814 RepID=UPI00397B741E
IDAKTASDEDLAAFLARHERVIAKPANGEGGAGISIISTADVTDVAAFRQGLIENDQTLIEEVLRQHADLDRLYPDSVNTVRM